MNPIRAILDFSLRVAVLLAGTMATTPTFAQPNDLKTAVQQLLAHGDLSDIDALARLTGISVRIAKASDSSISEASKPLYKAVVTQSPSFIYANWARYEIDVRESETRIRLSFQPREHADIWAWANEWRLPAKVDMPMHGKSSTVVSPTQPDGIMMISGVKSLELLQNIPRIKEFPNSAIDPPGNGQALVHKIVSLIQAGDLRDVKTTQRILEADFTVTADALRNGKLYRGSVLLNRVMEGWDSGMFSYSANDSGWGSMPSPYQMPLELYPRTAALDLLPDLTQICMKAADIAAELDAQAIPYGMHTTDSNGRRFKVLGNNTFDLSAGVTRDCVSSLFLRQTTDAANSQSSPLRFQVSDSIVKSPPRLSAEARSQLTRMLESGQAVDIETIEISQSDAAELSSLIKGFLIEQGIQPDKIKSIQRNWVSARVVEVRPFAR